MDLKSIDICTLDTGKHDIGDEFLADGFGLFSVPYVINAQLSNRRSGTAYVKKMSEVSGTTRKPWKQKGTGRARAGSLRSVQFRKGRCCFGPNGRSYACKVNKKVAGMALLATLRDKLDDDKMIVVNNIESLGVKTKDVVNKFKQLDMGSALIVCADLGKADALRKSVKNIKNFDFLPVSALNVVDVVRHEFLLVDCDSINYINEAL